MYYTSLINQKIGKWTVLGVDSHGTGQKTKMLCRCDCGTIRSVDCYSLKHKLTYSCGKCKTIVKEDDYMRCIMDNGASFIFSPQDLEVVKSHSWSCTKGYIKTTINFKSVYFHKLILGASNDVEVDHINLNRFDNRRSNLRIASHAENQRNRRAHRDNQSGFKGVCLNTHTGKYFAYINADKKRTYLGSFATSVQAAKAYDDAAIILHGEFARLNFEKEKKYG